MPSSQRRQPVALPDFVTKRAVAPPPANPPIILPEKEPLVIPQAGVKFSINEFKSRNPRQDKFYIDSLTHFASLGLGDAGTGKTHVACAAAMHLLSAGMVERIIICRPPVEAGTRLGYMPGDLREKLDHYLQPLYDELTKVLAKRDPATGEFNLRQGANDLDRMIKSGKIVIQNLGFLRGRTFEKSTLVLDEAQNTTRSEIYMAYSRLGEGSNGIFSGDPVQNDLPKGDFEKESGFSDFVDILHGLKDPAIASTRFLPEDISRHEVLKRTLPQLRERLFAQPEESAATLPTYMNGSAAKAARQPA